MITYFSHIQSIKNNAIDYFLLHTLSNAYKNIKVDIHYWIMFYFHLHNMINLLFMSIHAHLCLMFVMLASNYSLSFPKKVIHGWYISIGEWRPSFVIMGTIKCTPCFRQANFHIHFTLIVYIDIKGLKST